MSFLVDSTHRFVNKVEKIADEVGNSVKKTVKINVNDRSGVITTWKIISIATLIIGLALTFFSGTLWVIVPSLVLSTLAAILIVDTFKVSNRLNDLGCIKGLVENSVFLNVLADDTILLRHIIA